MIDAPTPGQLDTQAGLAAFGPKFLSLRSNALGSMCSGGLIDALGEGSSTRESVSLPSSW